MENMKPKKPFIIPVTWNPEFCTWGTNPQNNNSPSLLPLVKGTLNKPGLSFSLGVFLHRRGAYKAWRAASLNDRNMGENLSPI